MKPLTKIAETALDSGGTMELWERDESFFMTVDGMQTASSFSHGSDDTAAELAAAPVKRANQPTFLIAGLNLGFQLSALMNEINREKASFIVAEPLGELVEWHGRYLADLHPGMLSDPRVTIEPMSALAVARKKAKCFHAILIKSTHGRCDMTIAEASDYFASLRQGGLLVVTIAKPDSRLRRTLMKAGFEVSDFVTPASHKGKKTNFHTIILAKKGQFASFSTRNASHS